jgi:hypothetical protein
LGLKTGEVGFIIAISLREMIGYGAPGSGLHLLLSSVRLHQNIGDKHSES